MGSQFLIGYIVHAEWFLVFRSFATSSQRLKTAIGPVHNNNNNNNNTYYLMISLCLCTFHQISSMAFQNVACVTESIYHHEWTVIYSSPTGHKLLPRPPDTVIFVTLQQTPITAAVFENVCIFPVDYACQVNNYCFCWFCNTLYLHERCVIWLTTIVNPFKTDF